VRRLGLAGGVILALACGGGGGGVAVGGGGVASDGGQYSCHAWGTWEECSTANGWETCNEQVSEGLGLSLDQGTSEYDART
jgi:hypothetical protein